MTTRNATLSAHERELGALRARVAELEAALERGRAAELVGLDYRDFFERLNAVFWIDDAPGERPVFVSRAYEEVWGKSCESLYERPDSWLDAVHPDDVDRVRSASETGEPESYDEVFRIQRPNGEIRWVHARNVCVFREPYGLVRVVHLAEDVTAKRETELALESMAGGLHANDAESLLEPLVLTLVRATGADGVFVNELSRSDPTLIQTVTACMDGEIVPNFEYDLHGSPCEQVFGDEPCLYPEGVQELFPDDEDLVELGVEGYAGTPLVEAGEVIGILVAIYRSRIRHPDLVRSIFQICAERAGAELGRMRKEQVLQRANERLARRVERRTEELAKSEERYRVLIERATEGIWLMEAEEPVSIDLPREEQVKRIMETVRLVECNDAVARSLGYRRASDIVGMRGNELYPIPLSMKAAITREFIDADYQLTDHDLLVETDGEAIYLRISLIAVIEDRKLSRFWCTQRDVTELKREEQALRESEMNSKAIIQSALDGIAILDRNARVVTANDALCRMTGYGVEELCAGSADVFYGGRTEDVPELLERIEREGAVRTQSTIVRKDTSTFDVEVFARHQDVDGGRFYLYLHDLTQRLAAQERERQHQEQLAHFSRLNTIGEMATGIAHELNQPLAAIVNYTSGCLRRMSDAGGHDPDLIQALEGAASQATRAGEIIRRMRNFVRKGDHQHTVCSINSIVTETVQFMQSRARQLSIDLRLELCEGPDTIRADVIQIEQVLLNLMWNASESLEGVDEKERTLVLRTESDDSGFLTVTVRDTGVGMPPGKGEEIFGPFYTTKPGGLGLGLSISRSIIESHGGSLWSGVPDDEIGPGGPGAAFHFTLPAMSR